MNKLLGVVILVAAVSLVFSPSLANAEINLIPPPSNWEPDLGNYWGLKWWYQDSTNSGFVIMKLPTDQFPAGVPHKEAQSLFSNLSKLAPKFSKDLAKRGFLNSTEQITFGHNNSGYRYFLNVLHPIKYNKYTDSPREGSIGYWMRHSPDVPFKLMFILTEKQGELYLIFFGSPIENFDSKLSELKPTLDSIELTNSTALAN